MNRQHSISNYLSVIILLLCAILLSAGEKAEASSPSPNYFTVILPAEALLKTIQPLLPLEFTPKHSSFSGTLQIDSIDHISIGDGILNLSGIISGRDMTINTSIGGQDFKLKLGQLTIPAACDLHLRFDQNKKQLFITPHLHQNHNIHNTDNNNGHLSMINDMISKEYPLDIGQLLSFNLTINGQSQLIRMEPVDIITEYNQLIIKLKPVKNAQVQ